MVERDILIAARKLIERPEAWTKRRLARDKSGDEVSVDAPEAVCWCSSGAITMAARGLNVPVDAYSRVRKKVRTVIGHPSIVDWNDSPERTHADVLEAFDRAISDG